jgi:hypothetical protein
MIAIPPLSYKVISMTLMQKREAHAAATVVVEFGNNLLGHH